MGMPLTEHRFTVDEYHRMGDAGIFHDDDRVELIDGRIVEMSPIGGRHVACVIRLTNALAPLVGARGLVSGQNPLVLGRRSEPVPDVVVLRRRDDLSGAWLPAREDALLVIEVAETSLRYDRETKIGLYAEAGVPEVWLVNLLGDAVEIYSDPLEGGYRDIRTARRGETIAPLAFPDLRLPVAEILG